MQRAWQQLQFDLAPPKKPEPQFQRRVCKGESDLDLHRKRISGYMSIVMPEPVDLVFTKNRSTMISFRQKGGRMLVRLHRLFKHADRDILDALCAYLLKGNKKASLMINQFIEKHREEITEHSRPATPPISKGSNHDLIEVLERVNNTCFNSSVKVNIGWGNPPRKRRGRKRTRSRALATYNYNDQTIRVNPVLDASDVPEYVLGWIVYHEVLHHVLPVQQVGGRNYYHTAEFRALERAFPQYLEAKKWEDANLDRLLS